MLAIAERAMRAAKKARVLSDRSLQDWEMDVLAVHCNGFPLRLEALLVADDFNFSHDVFGIYRFLDRSTGQLGGHFVPRFVVQQ